MIKKFHTLMAAILLVSFMIFSAPAAKAQFGVGANISTQKFYGEASDLPMSLGLGLRGTYVITEKLRADVGFNYYFGSKIGTDNDYLKISTFNININGNYAFLNDFEETGITLYGVAGMGLNLYNGTSSFTNEDDEVETESETNSGANINLGIGGEYALENGLRIFAEPRIALGSGSTQTGFKPGYTGIDLGVRFMIGQ